MGRIAGIVGTLCILLSTCDALHEGESCKVARTGAAGTCKLLERCQPAIDALLRDEPPFHCEWKDRKQVICCPNPRSSRPSRPPINRISSRKCKEYEDAAYEKIYTAIGFGSQPIERKILRCFSSQVPLVINGVVANEKEFPHMALIGYRPNLEELSFKCGGSLISDRFILTAAHCILGPRLLGQPRVIRLGEHNRNMSSSAVVDIDVAESIPHPSYTRLSKYNDIGLIRMVRSVPFNEYIRPACLPEYPTTNTEKAIATGWGKTDLRGTESDILMKVTLELFPDDECRHQYLDESRSASLRDGIRAESQFCAGSRTEKKDVCQGDSGGPIQVDHPYNTCMYTIAGVTSFGKVCSHYTNNGTSGIYTRVYAYLDWIEGIVWPNQ